MLGLENIQKFSYILQSVENDPFLWKYISKQKKDFDELKDLFNNLVNNEY